jgi:PST family polysaccharide transporter
MTLLTTPMNNVVITVQQVMFPAYSRAQHDPAAVRRAYLASVSLVALVMLPAYACAALIPDTLVRGLFGQRWAAAIPLVVPLALAMPLHAAMAMAGPLLWAHDKVGKELRVQVVTAAALLAVLFVASRYSIVTVTWGVLGIYAIRFVLLTGATLRVVELTWLRLIVALRSALVVAPLAAAGVFAMDALLKSFHLPAGLTLFADLATGTLVYLASVILFGVRLLPRDLRSYTDPIASRVPRPLRAILQSAAGSALVGRASARDMEASAVA